MTEFRSKGKGKDRKVYPVNKRQPYGVTRKLASEDVLAMRNQGKKARLIETNKRLDLYAPYESTIPTPSVTKQGNSVIPESDPIPVTIDTVTSMKSQIEEVANTKDWGPLSVFSKDGKTYAIKVDNEHITMLYEESEGSIQGNGERPVGQKVMIPKVDYSDSNSSKFLLDKIKQKELMKMIREHKDADDIVFHKPSGSYDVYVFLRGEDEDRRNPVILGEPMKFMMQNSNAQEFTTHVAKDYFRKAMKAMNGLEKVNNTQSLNVKFRNDYPVEISGSSNTIGFVSLIAPKMPDFESKAIKILHEKVGIGSGN